jgi:hypothetical protein
MLRHWPWFVITALALVLIVVVTLIAHDHFTAYNVPTRGVSNAPMR